MRRFALVSACFAFLVLICFSAPAHATVLHTYISGTGSDGNPCSRAMPCQSLATAHTATTAGGIISCVDAPASLGIVTITKSVTIDCKGTNALLEHGGIGVVINLDAGDALQRVHLRGFSVNGVGQGTRGISILTGATVVIEDMVVSGETQHGIIDVRATPSGKLVIKNTTVTANGITGVAVAASGSTNVATLDNVTSVGNGYGIAVASGNKASISHSVFSSNSTAGVETDPGGLAGMESSIVAFNGTGLQAFGTLFISNSDIRFNQTGMTGVPVSFGNNRIYGNSGSGSSPALNGGATSDHGQD